MLGFERDKICRLLSEFNGAANVQKNKIADLKKKAGRISAEISAAEQEEKNINGIIAATKEALVVEKGIPENLGRLREAIIEAMRQEKRDDIFVKTRDELKKRIKLLKAELQKRCGHPFVMTTESYYAGSYINDCEDRHAGHRICVVCGFEEYSHKSVETRFLHDIDVYNILRECDSRLERWYTIVNWSKEEETIWQPLDGLIEKYFVSKSMRDIAARAAKK